MARRIVTLVGVGLAVALAAVVALAGYWLLRPNRAQVDPALAAEVWPVVSDGPVSYTHLDVYKRQSIVASVWYRPTAPGCGRCYGISSAMPSSSPTTAALPLSLIHI